MASAHLQLITSVLIAFSVLLSTSKVSGLIVEGHIQSKEDWLFVSRFCFRDSLGVVEFRFEYLLKDCCASAVLYYDTQWSKVYPQLTKTCAAKLAETTPANNQILDLKQSSYCKVETINGVQKLVCTGSRKLLSQRARWWYLVISHCKSTTGIDMKYRMLMTNGDSFWTKHFSADEQRILQPNIFFLVGTLMLMLTGVMLAAVLKTRQLLHYTYRLFLWSLFFELISLIFDVSYYTDYGQTGIPQRALQVIQRGCHSISDIILLLTLILVAKGWTVTRGRISSSGQVKLGVFFTLYTIGYVAIYIYEAKAFDPGKVLYMYESPAGIGLCILRVLAWMWFCYGTFFTLKHYPTKYLFYYPFWFFYTIWFLSGPIFVVIATYILDSWIRAQVMNGIDRSATFLAYSFFLFLTRPSTANKNFPYHVRTSQVGILDDTDNFTQHPYAPSGNGAASNPAGKEFSSIAAMFNANSAETVTFKGVSNGTSNPSNDTLLHNSTASNTPSGTPPEYQTSVPNMNLFQASNTGKS